jgi:hypothetical protein
MGSFRYSLRGLLLVTTLLAVSFSLIRTSHFPDEPTEIWQLVCFWAGALLLISTVSSAAGHLVHTGCGMLMFALLFVLSLVVGLIPVMWHVP